MGLDDWEGMSVEELTNRADDLRSLSDKRRREEAADLEAAREIARLWPEHQARRRALEDKYAPMLARLKHMTHAELKRLGDEIHQYIEDDLASGCTLLCSAEVACVALMKIQIIDEERRRRIVSNAFGTPGQQRALKAFANKSKKRREPLVERTPTRKVKAAPGQQKLF